MGGNFDVFDDDGPFATGVAEIDRQHVELEVLFRRVVDAARDEKVSLEAVRTEFISLADSLTRHFAEEEELLGENRNEERGEMCAEHERIIHSADNAARHLGQGSRNRFLQAMFELEDQILHHMGGMDRDLLG